jgi:hypothetical protein
MNRRMLIGAVTALSMASVAGITAASAEPDSSGAGGASYGYQTGPGYAHQGYASQDYVSDGSMAYGSANVRVRDGYAGPRTSYQYRAQPRGGLCLDEDGNRFACR